MVQEPSSQLKKKESDGELKKAPEEHLGEQKKEEQGAS